MRQIVDRFNLQQGARRRGHHRQAAHGRLSRPGAARRLPLRARDAAARRSSRVALFYLFWIIDLAAAGASSRFGIALGVAYVGFYAPILYVSNVIQKRQKSIRRAWPDALDLMLICVESGMSAEAAFRKVSEEIGAQSIPLAEELTLTTAELSYLQERRQAYENLGDAHRPRGRQGGDDQPDPGRALRHAARHRAARACRRKTATSA